MNFETAALSQTTGFTQDVSRSGLFVRTIRIPPVGKRLKAVVRLADGRSVPIEGTVVRSYRAPVALRSVVPTGFGLRLTSRSQEFERLAADQ